MFSILVAHYNNYEYFKDCYKSIIGQTFQNFEDIIVDDCSTDDSLEKIRNLVSKDQRFKIYTNQENKGVGYTKKRCIGLANGDICGFLDPDDALLPNALQLSIDTHNKYKNIVATYSKFYICNDNLAIEKIFLQTRKIKNRQKFFFNINLEVAHFFTFKKDAYLQTEGMISQYRIAEDQDLYLKLYEIGDFYFIDEPLLLYRLHGKGLSHDKQKTEERNKIWHKVLLNAINRRNINEIFGKKVSEIESLPKFIFKKENTLLNKIKKIINIFSNND